MDDLEINQDVIRQEFVRYLVLNRSLEIESKLSEILKYLLGLEKEDDNKSLGFKGSALSLKAKVDLLFDINKIEKDLYKELILFMEIRNQFVHNLDSRTFEVVTKRINKQKKILDIFEKNKKLPNHEGLDLENKLRVGFLGMTQTMLKELKDIHIHIIEERILRLKNETNGRLIELYQSTIKHVDSSIDEMRLIINQELENEFGDNKNFGDKFMVKFSQLIKEKIDLNKKKDH